MMLTIGLHSPLNISETVRGLIPMTTDHNRKCMHCMPIGYGHTMVWGNVRLRHVTVKKVKLVPPIRLERNISKQESCAIAKMTARCALYK